MDVVSYLGTVITDRARRQQEARLQDRLTNLRRRLLVIANKHDPGTAMVLGMRWERWAARQR